MKTILGINHQFLYEKSMTDAEAHTETLAKLSSSELVDALDCWCWRGERAKREIEILRASGKIINYNIGDRFGEAAAVPSSPDKAERDHAYSTVMREIEYGIALGSKKIVIGSGKDFPADRDSAKERFFEFIMKIGEELPPDVTLALEPTDRDIDKYFLFGPMDETVEFIKRVRASGLENFGMLLDQCHIPLMHETVESAVSKLSDTLVHVHLGNCLLSDKSSPMYGDKHPAWSYPGSEYTEDDGARYLALLKKIGYTEKTGNTVTFEMRPYLGKTPEESLAGFVKVYREAMK